MESEILYASGDDKTTPREWVIIYDWGLRAVCVQPGGLLHIVLDSFSSFDGLLSPARLVLLSEQMAGVDS